MPLMIRKNDKAKKIANKLLGKKNKSTKKRKK